MANILTASEGAAVLRTVTTDSEMLYLLPLVDGYVKHATGRDWAAESTIPALAKNAARMLLVLWHENPAMVGNVSSLNHGLAACLAQLEALAGRYFVFQGGGGAGLVSVPGAKAGDSVTTLVGKVGVSGDQSASFATVIEYDDYLEQLSTSDLSDYWYQVQLTPVWDA